MKVGFLTELSKNKDAAIRNLLEKMKDKSRAEETETDDTMEETAEDDAGAEGEEGEEADEASASEAGGTDADEWSDLDVNPDHPTPLSPEAQSALNDADVIRGDHPVRCAQPPHNHLPIPRADIPPGIILSREVDAWIREQEVEDVALPLYLGKMLYVNRWAGPLEKDAKNGRYDLMPDFLIGTCHLRHDPSEGMRVVFRDIARTTDQRTFIPTLIPAYPCANVLPLTKAQREK